MSRFNLFDLGFEKTTEDFDIQQSELKIYRAIDKASLSVSKKRDSDTSDAEVVIGRRTIEQ